MLNRAQWVQKNNQHIILDGIRFLLAGCINTLLTLAIFQISLFFFNHELSYAISWLCGIGYLLLVYPSKVFKGAEQSAAKKARVIIVYITTFLLSYLFLNGLVELGMHARAAIFIVILFTVTTNFFLMYFIFRGKKHSLTI